MTDITALPRCGLLRRFAAIVYDGVLLVGLTLAAAALVQPFYRVLRPDNLVFTLYFAGVIFLFFGWFWTHGGQTLGMRAWRIRVVCPDGEPITWQQALLRYVAAMVSWLTAGAGFFWALVDKEKRTLHDLVSGTVLVVLPKKNAD